jgi:hypothetical protein
MSTRTPSPGRGRHARVVRHPGLQDYYRRTLSRFAAAPHDADDPAARLLAMTGRLLDAGATAGQEPALRRAGSPRES